MTGEIRRRPQAVADIVEVAVFLGRGNADAAEHFVKAVDVTLEQLARNPEMGAPREFAVSALVKMRMVPVRNFAKYLVFYQYEEDSIEIIRVLHGARDIQTLLGGEGKAG